MKQEDIIKLAQEVGLIRAGEHHTEPARWGISEITDFYQRAVAAEREACARVCEEDVRDEYIRQDRPAQDEAFLFAAIADCAEAIRARGEQ